MHNGEGTYTASYTYTSRHAGMAGLQEESHCLSALLEEVTRAGAPWTTPRNETLQWESPVSTG